MPSPATLMRARELIARLSRTFLLMPVAVALAAFTTLGIATREQSELNYGPPMKMRVCLLKADAVSEHRAQQLIAAVNEEFSEYNIFVEVPWTHPWRRAGFQMDAIVQES